MIRVEVNAGDFMWEVLQDNLNGGNISQVQEAPGQYWGIGMYDLRCNVTFFYIDLSYCKERQSFVIPLLQIYGIDYIYYNLLSLKLPSVFFISLCL